MYRRLRINLYSKVLLWLMVNLFLLGALGAAFLWFQLPVGLDWLLSGPGGQRLEALSDVLTGELQERPEKEWDGVLQRYDAAHGMIFTLFNNDGAQVAGLKVTPTPAVLEKLVEHRANGDDGPGRKPRPQPPPPPRGQDHDHPRAQAGGRLDDGILPPPPEAVSLGPAPRRGAQGRPEDGAPPGNPPPARRDDHHPPHPRFLLRTEHPTQYWAGIHLGGVTQDSGRARKGLSLLVVSNSLTGNGMFLDTTPLIGLGLAGVALSAIVWLPLIGGMTRAIRRLNVASRSIAQGRFDIRVPDRRRDELGQLAASVNAMAAQLGQYVEKQRRLTADVAHELCSPIARMQMALGVVEQRALPEQQSYVDRLSRELQHMARLVEEVLSFSKAATLAERATAEEVSVLRLVNDVVNQEAADVDVRINVPADLRVNTLREALERALANVVRNAVRYASQHGPIEIYASESQSVEGIEVFVRDHGPGVPDEALPKLFEPFYRPEAARGRKTGGSGLGLAIVRRCVEACGGDVQVARAEPTGLWFTFWLPQMEMAPALAPGPAGSPGYALP